MTEEKKYFHELTGDMKNIAYFLINDMCDREDFDFDHPLKLYTEVLEEIVDDFKIFQEKLSDFEDGFELDFAPSLDERLYNYWLFQRNGDGIGLNDFCDMLGLNEDFKTFMKTQTPYNPTSAYLTDDGCIAFFHN